MAEASELLLPPGEPAENVSKGYTNPGDLFNYLSPSAWVAEIIEKASGWNPIDYAAEYFTGEWAEFHKFGTALEHLADFMQQVGVDIQNGLLGADRSWSGNAADSAFVYFTDLASSVSRQQVALNAAAQGYHDAAKGVWQITRQLGNIFQAMIDAAVLAGIAAAAGTITMATGVGAVAGYSMAGYQAARILQLVAQASKIINTALIVIMGLFGGAVALTGQGGDLSRVGLPSAGFHLPRA